MRIVLAIFVATLTGCAIQPPAAAVPTSNWNAGRGPVAGIPDRMWPGQALPQIDKSVLATAEPADLEALQPTEEISRPPTALPAELNLEELERIAIRSNPSLGVARAKIDAARGDWLQAGLHPNPTVGYVADDIGHAGRLGLQGLYVAQTFVTAGKLQLSQAAAESEIVRLQQAWEAQRLRVLTDVRTQFYRALIAQRRFESAEKLVGIAEEAAEAAEKLLQAQEGRRIDVLQARVEAARAKLALRKTKNRHIAAWRALAAVVGNADLPRGPLEGDIDSALPTLDWQSSLEYVLSDSPELAAASVDIERAQRTLQRELAKASPNWDAELRVQYDTEADDLVAGISMGLPIPSRNRNQGAIHRAEAEIVAAEQDLHRLKFLLQQRLASAFQNYADARLTVAKHDDDILPNAKQTIDLVTQGFEAGEVPYVDLLTAQRTFFQANLEYMDSLERLWSAAKYIEGFALDESLSQIKD